MLHAHPTFTIDTDLVLTHAIAMILRHLALLGSLLFAPASSSTLSDAERASNQSLLWGPYRPNLYFGVRPRIPESLSLGLLWARVEDYNSVQDNFRYTCEQHEGMAGYGWSEYDARTGGVQTIHDAGNQIDITTSFFKDTSAAAGDKGGNWGVRIRGVPREGAPKDLKTTVVVNVNLEGQYGVFKTLEVKKPKEEGTDWFVGDVVLEGQTPGLGGFKLVVTGDEGTTNKHPSHGHPSGMAKSLDRTLVNSKMLGEEAIWQSKRAYTPLPFIQWLILMGGITAILFTLLKHQIDEYIQTYTQENLPPPAQLYTVKPEPGPGNAHFIQKVFEGAFEFDVLFSSAASTHELTSSDLTTGLASTSSAFAKRFESVFAPQKPFTGQQYVEFGKSLFSNLLGGIGFFHGDWKVDRSDAEAYEEENEGFWVDAAEARARAGFSMEGPSTLFTSIPSRPFFPRGFLWDEGFHLLPVLEWDTDLTMQIVRSWFSLMDEDGWIAREQILGPEARSKVPDEFQVQYPHYANPPSLFLTLTTLIERLTSPSSSGEDAELAKEHLKELYPLLQRHYDWFRRTQRGDLSSYERPNEHAKEGYRWRGRTERHCLTSGLDDFPRAQPPHPGELHVDALAWVALMSSSLGKIAGFLGEKEDVGIYRRQHQAQRENGLALHWSKEEGSFCDATIDEFEEHRLVCHKGYVTLLPFMVGFLDPEKDADKIAAILKTLGSEEELWSQHGVRSLSLSDALYGTDENYWRGPVWVNMNYLILTRLLALSSSPSSPSTKAKANQKEAAKLYKQLRENLVNTIFESWKETGFAWEQYHPDTGRGQRTQHFTGWTSLVVKVLGMPESAGAGDGKEGNRRDEL